MQPIHTVYSKHIQDFQIHTNHAIVQPPNLRVLLSPKTHPRAEITSTTDQPLIFLGAAYLSSCSPKHVSNSASIIARCFSSCLAQASHFRDSLNLFYAFPQLFQLFYLFPTTFLIIGEIQILPQKSKLELIPFKDF